MKYTKAWFTTVAIAALLVALPSMAEQTIKIGCFGAQDKSAGLIEESRLSSRPPATLVCFSRTPRFRNRFINGEQIR